MAIILLIIWLIAFGIQLGVQDKNWGVIGGLAFIFGVGGILYLIG